MTRVTMTFIRLDPLQTDRRSAKNRTPRSYGSGNRFRRRKGQQPAPDQWKPSLDVLGSSAETPGPSEEVSPSCVALHIESPLAEETLSSTIRALPTLS